MSPDNLDTLRAFYEAGPDGEDVLQYLDPAVELYPASGHPIRTPSMSVTTGGRSSWSTPSGSG